MVPTRGACAMGSGEARAPRSFSSVSASKAEHSGPKKSLSRSSEGVNPSTWTKERAKSGPIVSKE
eukprot:6554604-Pyramimonas_sp.AAC.1